MYPEAEDERETGGQKMDKAYIQALKRRHITTQAAEAWAAVNIIYLTTHCRVCNVTPFTFDCNK